MLVVELWHLFLSLGITEMRPLRHEILRLYK